MTIGSYKQFCPVAMAAEILCTRWTVVLLRELVAGSTRFNELRSQVDGISQRMLTVTLRGLERDGIVARTVYPEVPPRVEYALTPLGATLRQLVRALVAWSGDHLVEVDAARAAYDARNGRTSRSPSLARPVASVRSRSSRAAG